MSWKGVFFIFVVFLLPFSAMCNNGTETGRLYATIAREKYVSGRFYPAKYNMFSDPRAAGIDTDGRRHFLRNETIGALKEMTDDFKKENPGIGIKIISSTRNFYDQRAIWESKWNGSRKVDGVDIRKLNLDDRSKGLKILKFSSMPGTSRHHWGTDFDINSLENSYFTNGNGEIIYNWLKKNASRYGFGQPYGTGRSSGYEEEKWHWSYLPLARHFRADWMRFYEENNRFIIDSDVYSGCEELYQLSPLYVNSIDPECL